MKTHFSLSQKKLAKPFKQLGRLSMLRYFLFEASFGA